MSEGNFTILVSDPDFNEGLAIWLDRSPGWLCGPRSRSYCRRVARQSVFEGADYALVVDLSTGEIVCTYTPNNAPVARLRQDGRCPIQHGNDTDELLSRH